MASRKVAREQFPSKSLHALLFRLAAICLPLLVLLSTEAIWRWVAPEPPFLPVPDHPEYLTINPLYGARYFRGFQPQVAYNPFLKHKPEGVFRIVALGGSSTAGYPYHYHYAFPERLATRLRARAPLRQIEMINLGMTAVNSHVLRDLAPAVRRLVPDAVLVYAGHNEYYGAFGAGTGTAGLGRKLWVKRVALLLKRTKTYRALENLIAPPARDDRTMMARSVGDASIALGSDAYDAGLRQFEANMVAVLRRLRAVGIDVYIATVFSNLDGQPPLGGNAAAQNAFAEGQARLASGDSLHAWSAFMRAKELDHVRFRAPEAVNEIIRRLAEAHEARLVDLAGQPWADTLFTDHLHPTATGHELVAEAFATALDGPTEPIETRPTPGALNNAIADLQITRLKNGFPFKRDLTPEQEMRIFGDHLQEYLLSGRLADSLAARVIAGQLMLPQALLSSIAAARAARDTLSALRYQRALLYWQPFNQELHREAVGLAAQSQLDLALSGEIVQLSVARFPETDYLNALAAIRLRQGMHNASRQLLSEVESREPNSPVMLFNMARLLVQTGDTLRARDYFARYQRVAALP